MDKKTKKVVESTEENSSPMGSLEQIKTIKEAPLATGEVVARVKMSQIYFTNYSDEDIELPWDGKGYIYKARTRAPVQIGGMIENQNVRRKWAVVLANREWGKLNPPATGIEGKSRLPSESQLMPLVQRALEVAPIGEAEFGSELEKDPKRPYHVLKPTGDIPELSSQMPQ
jgi:hypothetical protein